LEWRKKRKENGRGRGNGKLDENDRAKMTTKMTKREECVAWKATVKHRERERERKREREKEKEREEERERQKETFVR